MKRIFLCLILPLCLLLAGCADHEAQASVVKKRPEPDENTVYENNTVYRWAKPNHLEFVLPRVPEPVPQEAFFADYGPVGSQSASFDCVSREAAVITEEFQAGGGMLCYPNDEGGFSKVCTDEECRADLSLPCMHLVGPGAVNAVRYEDAVYFAAPFIEPDGSVKLWGVLEWKIGAGDFDKLFDTENMICSLHAVNGILYIQTRPNLRDVPDEWYAVRMDREICTEVSVEDILIFGEDGIVSVSRTDGVTLLDEFLNPVRMLLGAPVFGAIAGGYYWYLQEGDLMRIAADRRGSGEKILSGISDFSVSPRYIWTVDAGNGELWRAQWKQDGSLSGQTPLYVPEKGEHVALDIGPVAALQKPIRGDTLVWTVETGDGITVYCSAPRKDPTILWTQERSGT